MTTMLAGPSLQVTPCSSNPNRWTEAGDDPVLKARCRGWITAEHEAAGACPRRMQCAREALTMPGASGIWAGIYLPPEDPRSPRHDASRAREYAMTRLAVIAGLA